MRRARRQARRIARARAAVTVRHARKVLVELTCELHGDGAAEPVAEVLYERRDGRIRADVDRRLGQPLVQREHLIHVLAHLAQLRGGGRELLLELVDRALRHHRSCLPFSSSLALFGELGLRLCKLLVQLPQRRLRLRVLLAQPLGERRVVCLLGAQLVRERGRERLHRVRVRLQLVHLCAHRRELTQLRTQRDPPRVPRVVLLRARVRARRLGLPQLPREATLDEVDEGVGLCWLGRGLRRGRCSRG
mmetsp:Transcript_395/g.999  ORF Transcript_395/g.999 Transcript_395/m.999 type:complete len:248 (-) Transcript_395:688-1431(-)